MTDAPLPMLAALMMAGLVSGCGPSPSATPETPAAAQADAGDAAAARLGIEIPRPLENPSAAQAQAPDETSIARAILANPAAYRPESYVYVTKYLWERGDRQQAAFWHFLFQIRTAPWLAHEPQLGPFRAGVNGSIGATINEWLGSDFDAWLETTRRAIGYERRIPLSPERPAGFSESQWSAEVARARASWEADFHQITGPGGPSKAQMDTQRRSNGRYVGPLQDPGAPLPSDWR